MPMVRTVTTTEIGNHASYLDNSNKGGIGLLRENYPPKMWTIEMMTQR